MNDGATNSTTIHQNSMSCFLEFNQTYNGGVSFSVKIGTAPASVSSITGGNIATGYLSIADSTNNLSKTTHSVIAPNYTIENVLDTTQFEKEGKFLEGTGSMVLDHQNKIAYGCLSERLDKEAFTYWCDKMQFKPISFKAFDDKAQPIYHTNVLMCMANQFVVICLDSISNEKEKKMLLDSFLQTQKEVIDISQDQLNHFAGNMLQVFDITEKPHLIMSEQAYKSLHTAQLKSLEKYNPLIPIAIPTIEALGGGSTRCMMAEIYLNPA